MRIGIERALFIGIAVILAWLVLYPVAMLLIAALTTDTGRFTLEYLRSTAGLSDLGEIIWNTLAVSVAATALALVIGLLCAFLIARTDLPMSGLFEFISIVPFLTPPIVAGLAWEQLAERQSGLINLLLKSIHIGWHLDIMSLGGIIFVTSLYLVPFVVLITVNGLRSVNPELEEASLTSGCTMLRTLFRVTLPLIVPAIGSSALLAFMYSNILFGIHATLGLPVNIWFITTAIYQAVNVVPAETHRAAVLSGLLMVIAAVATVLQFYLQRNGKNYQTISGKGRRVKKVALGPWRWVACAFCAGYTLVVTVLPYTILFLRSLKPFMFVAGMTWTDLVSGWNLAPYYTILSMRDVTTTNSILNSVILGIGSAAACVAVASIAAIFVIGTRFRGRLMLTFLCMVPMALPGVVLGIAVLRGYSQKHLMLYGTLWIFLVAYLIQGIPLAYNSIRPFLVQIHTELEEAARVCGAAWLRQLRTITVPLARSGIVVGFVLVLASVLREIGVSIILYTQGNEVVAYILFNQWENGDLQALSAFLMLTTALTFLLVVVFLRLGRAHFAELTGAEVRQS